MTITFTQIGNIYEVSSALTEEKLPMRVSYKIMKILTRLEEELNFYRNSLNKLIDEYALKDENGQLVYSENGENIKIQEDKIEDFNNEYIELNNMEIEISDDYLLSLGELETLSISPKDLYKIEPLIIEK